MTDATASSATPAPTPDAVSAAPPPDPVAPQTGIANRPPEHLLIAAFELTEGADVRGTIESLRSIQTEELQSRLPPETIASDKTQPGPETGELGFVDGFDRAHLTITIGFSSSAFDKLSVAPANRPQDLVPIPWAQLGDSPEQADQGDIVVQVCSDDPYVCEHVVHRIEFELKGKLSIVWTQVGAQRYTARQGRTSRAEGRAVIGFIDGTENLHLGRCPAGDTDLVFVDPTTVSSYPPLPAPTAPNVYGQPTPPAFPADLRPPPSAEPPWTKNGTYMAVRSSLIDFQAWDSSSLGQQEAAIGKFKLSGAFLDNTDDPAALSSPPQFATNQANTTVPLTAHARKANPRAAGDEVRRIFRRGYPIIAGNTAGLDRGLVFISFGRTLSTQFEFIFRAWMRNPNFPTANAGPDALFRFETKVLCGGYYFVPPLADACEPSSWILPSD